MSKPKLKRWYKEEINNKPIPNNCCYCNTLCDLVFTDGTCCYCFNSLAYSDQPFCDLCESHELNKVLYEVWLYANTIQLNHFLKNIPESDEEKCRRCENYYYYPHHHPCTCCLCYYHPVDHFEEKYKRVFI